MRLLLSAFLVTISLQAQVAPNPWFDFTPLQRLKEFLQLSDSQLQAILANNDDYNRWSSEKQTRVIQVQREIAEETAKEPLDPNALGIRYAEIETICRQMRDRAKEGRAKNIEALTPDQRTKLAVLEQALALAPTIGEAQFGNLAGDLTSAPSAFTGASGGIYSSSGIIGLAFPANGCQAAARWIETTQFQREPFPRTPAVR